MPATHVTIIGNVCDDLDLHHTKTAGRPVTNFHIATNDRNPDGTSSEPLRLRVVAYDETATGAVNTLHKGDHVIVHGTIQHKTHTNPAGETIQYIELKAYAIGLNTRFHPATKDRDLTDGEKARITELLDAGKDLRTRNTKNRP